MVERTGTERPLTMSVGQTRNACRDLLHDRHGALADERDGHRMGADAVARDSAGFVGGTDEAQWLNDGQ